MVPFSREWRKTVEVEEELGVVSWRDDSAGRHQSNDLGIDMRNPNLRLRERIETLICDWERENLRVRVMQRDEWWLKVYIGLGVGVRNLWNVNLISTKKIKLFFLMKKEIYWPKPNSKIDWAKSAKELSSIHTLLFFGVVFYFVLCF